MSLRDPLNWLKSRHPGMDYETITLRIKDGGDDQKSYLVDAYGSRNVHSYNAVLDWLEKSPVYIWPYADAFPEDDLRQITVTLQVDSAVTIALSSVDSNLVAYSLAETVSRTLAALSRHVDIETRNTVFINHP